MQQCELYTVIVLSDNYWLPLPVGLFVKLTQYTQPMWEIYDSYHIKKECVDSTILPKTSFDNTKKKTVLDAN